MARSLVSNLYAEAKTLIALKLNRAVSTLSIMYPLVFKMPGLSNWYQIVRSHASFRWCFLQDFVTPKPFLFLFLLFIDAWCNKTTIRHKCLTVIYVSMHALLLNLLLLQMNDSTIQYF